MGRGFIPGVDKIPESWVKDRVKAILDKYKNIKWDMPPASEMGTAGRHDFIICQRGLFWTIETKAGKNKPTDLQINYAIDIWNAGGMSLCINELNLSEAEAVVEYISTHGMLPYDLAHDFTKYRKHARKRRRASNVGEQPAIDHGCDPDCEGD